MGTYLLNWNPVKHWDWDDLEECIEDLNRDSYLDMNWSCGVTKKIVRGDRVFLMRLGDEPRGIIAFGKVQPYSHFDKGVRPVRSGVDVYQGPKWEDQNDPYDQGKTALYINVRWEHLLNPEHDTFPLYKLEELNEGLAEEEQQGWTPENSGITIKPKVAAKLEARWEGFLSSIDCT